MDQRSIAYFSMEIALEPGMPTYSGGLGVLAGDTLRSCADLAVPIVGVTLLHREGYLYQELDASGLQHESPVHWQVDDVLTELPARVVVRIEGREVRVRAWEYRVAGRSGYQVPVYFLDTDLPENEAWDRSLTGRLYGGDDRYRLAQEAILGIGGVRILRALGWQELRRFHMNEGHAALLTLELLLEARERKGEASVTWDDIERVRQLCVFTTHTPVPAGHDQFPLQMVGRVVEHWDALLDMHDVLAVDLANRIFQQHQAWGSLKQLAEEGARLNLTYLALNLSSYVNGVAKRHRDVSRLLFAEYEIDAVTNGVHAATWTAPPFADLYTRHIPGWQDDNFSLRYALSIPRQEIWEAHQSAKKELLLYIQREANLAFDLDHLTLGFARRAASYKRADLIFADRDRLRRIASTLGPLQLVFAGKAHPHDRAGKEIIQHIFAAAGALAPDVKVVYLPNYDLRLARLVTAGVDVWLNTPLPPNEASGTSGMKAALNGVPSLSVLDGWWVEGCIEGITGWAIGEDAPSQPDRHADSLYDKLETVVGPLFYEQRDRFLDIMRHAIALNGSFFNTQRMVQQYALAAYLSRGMRDADG